MFRDMSWLEALLRDKANVAASIPRGGTMIMAMVTGRRWLIYIADLLPNWTSLNMS